MSDDRFTEDPDVATPDRTYIDRKKPSWYGAAPQAKPAFNLAEEVEKFLAVYCEKFGIKPKGAKGKKLVRPDYWDVAPKVEADEAEDFER